MELVVDANILFAALIKHGRTADLLFNDELKLFAPTCLLAEFLKYRDELLEKSRREDFDGFVHILFERITLVDPSQFKDALEYARSFCPDRGDDEYLGLAFHRGSAVWSNDTSLKNQPTVPIITTTDLVRRFKL